HRNPRAQGNIIGDVIAADRDGAALFYCAVDIKNVIGGAAPDVDYECAEIFLVLGEHHLGGSERAENHVLDFKWQFFDAANRILYARPTAVNDMKIWFQFPPQHADRIEDAVLAVDLIVLNDRVKKGGLDWKAYLPHDD